MQSKLSPRFDFFPFHFSAFPFSPPHFSPQNRPTSCISFPFETGPPRWLFMLLPSPPLFSRLPFLQPFSVSTLEDKPVFFPIGPFLFFLQILGKVFLLALVTLSFFLSPGPPSSVPGFSCEPFPSPCFTRLSWISLIGAEVSTSPPPGACAYLLVDHLLFVPPPRFSPLTKLAKVTFLFTSPPPFQRVFSDFQAPARFCSRLILVMLF